MEAWGKFVNGRPMPEPLSGQRCWVQLFRDERNAVLALCTYQGAGVFGAWASWMAEEAYEDARFQRVAWRVHDAEAPPPVYYSPVASA